MPEKRTVEPGDCLLSLAAKAGIPVSRITTHPDNQALMAKRHHQNLLLPGDELTIPDKRIKHVSGGTELRHRFVKKLPKAEIRIRLYELGLPRRNEPYWVEVDGKRYEGESPTTDYDGLVLCRIPADAERATIVIGETRDRYDLLLGHIDPLDTVEGIHTRLANLGYYEGGIYTEYGADSIEAMSDFLAQKTDLDPDRSNPDDPEIRNALRTHYGS